MFAYFLVPTQGLQLFWNLSPAPRSLLIPRYNHRQEDVNPGKDDTIPKLYFQVFPVTDHSSLEGEVLTMDKAASGFMRGARKEIIFLDFILV